MSDLAKTYDGYYSPPEGSEGKSVYSARFGKYAIPASEIIMIATMVGAVLCRKAGYTSYRGYGNEKILASLEKLCKNEPEIEPEKLYRHIIDLAMMGIEGEQSLRCNPRISILDYGCGEGRYLELYNQLAMFLSEHGFELEICGFDIANQGLENFKENAQSNYGFACSDNCLTKGNLKIKLVHYPFNNLNNPILTKDLLRRGMGRFFGDEALRAEFFDPTTMNYKTRVYASGDSRVFDISLAMFGVIAYVTDEKERKDVLNLLREVTSDYVMMTYPTQKFLTGSSGNIIAENFETGVVTYRTFGGQELDYMLFGGDKEGRAGYNNGYRLEEEVASILAPENSFGTISIPFMQDFTAAHIKSHSTQDYLEEFAESLDVSFLKIPAYKFLVFKPDNQRLQNHHIR